MTPRIWAVCALAVLVAGAVVVAAVTIPWHRPPAPRADQLAALQDRWRDQAGRCLRIDLKRKVFLKSLTHSSLERG